MRISDWSSDVCSSDLPEKGKHAHGQVDVEHPAPREIIGQPAAERGADDRPEDRAHAPDRHRRAVAFGRTDVAQDRLAPRPERRAENALEQTESSEEHKSELQSLMRNSYAVICLKTIRAAYTND